MGDRSTLGLGLIAVGVVVIAVGALVWLGVLSWIGRLPGDIRVERPGVSFYAPITSMIIVSVVLTLLLSLVCRLCRAKAACGGGRCSQPGPRFARKGRFLASSGGFLMSLPHENLVAWQRADDLFIAIHRLTHQRFPVSERYELGSQLRRAAWSIPANLVEGIACGKGRESIEIFEDLADVTK